MATPMDLTAFQVKTKLGDVDTDLYSRQIATLGIEAQKRMQHLSVLIVGVNGVGVEVAKNIILAGVMQVVLHDPTPAQWADLSSQFYLTEDDVHARRTRAEASLPKLRELNSYVQVSATEPGATLEPALIQKYNFGVVVIADPLQHSFLELCLIDEFCRHQHHPIAFLMACAAGPLAFAFADFGAVHVSEDPDGLPAPQAIVNMISQDEKCVVTLAEESAAGGMPFQTGDTIHFTEVKGCAALNQGLYRVGETTKLTFVLEEGNEAEGFHAVDARQMPAHQAGTGLVFGHKRPLRMSFSSLSDSFGCPFRCPRVGDLPESMMDVDFRKMGRSRELHLLVRALFAFIGKNSGQLPRPGNAADADGVIECLKRINDAARLTNTALPAAWAHVAKEHCLDNVDEAAPALRLLAMHSAGNLSPMCAFLGGVIGQEVMKVTGKFTPLHQWLHFDIAEMVKELPAPEYEPLQCRYDGLIAVFGRSFQRKLAAQKLFLVGAGALGCEFAKGFAMMGAGLGSAGGRIVMTDMDTIEKSNLNRQFLFRPRDIGSHKSEAAARAMREMNGDLHVTAYTSAVGEDTEALFSDEEFWPSLDVVVNALDNIEARTYVDNKCSFHGKPLLESGTTGTMANVQVVIPRKTEAYSDSTDFAEAVGVPQCTIRNFPNLIMHCIEWSVAEDTLGSYNKLFKLNVALLKEYAKDPAAFLKELPGRMNVSQQRETLEHITEALADMPMTFEKCVAWARLKFEKFFHDEIVQLLVFHPASSLDTLTGQPFWSGSKRLPHPLVFDPANVHHMQFIHCAANLRAYSFGLPPRRINTPEDYQYFVDVLRHVIVPPFVPKSAPAKAGEEGQSKDASPALYTAAEEEEIVARMVAAMPHVPIDAARIRPAKFEKDDDTNFHVDYCTATANLRGANYNIEPADRLAVKTAAGRIIPALATTTAMVTGLVLNQLCLLVQGCDDIAKYSNGSANIGNHVWGFSEPLPPRRIQNSTEWRIQTMQYKKEEAAYKAAGDNSFKWRIRAVPEGFYRRDYIEFRADPTLQAVVAHFHDKFGLDVNMITLGKGMMYDSGSPAHRPRLAKTISELARTMNPDKPLKGYVILSLTVSDPATDLEINETVFTPDVLVYFK